MSGSSCIDKAYAHVFLALYMGLCEGAADKEIHDHIHNDLHPTYSNHHGLYKERPPHLWEHRAQNSQVHTNYSLAKHKIGTFYILSVTQQNPPYNSFIYYKLFMHLSLCIVDYLSVDNLK